MQAPAVVSGQAQGGGGGHTAVCQRRREDPPPAAARHQAPAEDGGPLGGLHVVAGRQRSGAQPACLPMVVTFLCFCHALKFRCPSCLGSVCLYRFLYRGGKLPIFFVF